MAATEAIRRPKHQHQHKCHCCDGPHAGMRHQPQYLGLFACLLPGCEKLVDSFVQLIRQLQQVLSARCGPGSKLECLQLPSSGLACRHDRSSIGDGAITTQCQSSPLRFLLVEAAQAAVRWDPDWRRRFVLWPRWSPQNRPYVVTSKPAIERFFVTFGEPRLALCRLCRAS